MSILLIGAGKMGTAILNGWIKSGIKKSDIQIVDPAIGKNFADLPVDYKPKTILVAVKPQIIKDILPELKKFDGANIISILAGTKLATFKKVLKKSLIIRTMPNLPAIIGEGVIAAIASRKIKLKEAMEIVKLLDPCGQVHWVKSEDLIDSFTAISGSGPAYVFLFADALAQSAEKLGIDKKISRQIALQTIKGSVLMAAESDHSLTELKQAVTSKGGTTEAALKKLEKGGAMKKLVNSATKAAKTRAKQLAK